MCWVDFIYEIFSLKKKKSTLAQDLGYHNLYNKFYNSYKPLKLVKPYINIISCSVD